MSVDNNPEYRDAFPTDLLPMRVPDCAPATRESGVSDLFGENRDLGLEGGAAAPRSSAQQRYVEHVRTATTLAAAEFPAHSLGPDAVGERWAIMLRLLGPPRDQQKLIARDFGVEPGTVKHWLAGQAPQVRHLAKAVEVYGRAAVLFLLSGNKEDLAFADAERTIDALRDKIAALGGAEDG